MPLEIGSQIGSFQIVGLLGSGGMGEVYKARDTRLERHVALKVLSGALAVDPEFRERFEREAKSISALSHPNICALYDIGRQVVGTSTVDYLVMELVDGETMAARLARGPVPLAEALEIAIQIASALDRAHRHGVVHRDLKPANVMLTKSGAKLLDFGLAKTGSGVLAMTDGMTATQQALTARGTILGTLQYMAPEQIEGEGIDPRTDIFALGAMLFELVTGRKAFDGKSQVSLIGAILKDETPPVSQLVPVSPPALDHLVRTCLSKDKDDRYQTAHDLVLQLRWIARGDTSGALAVPAGLVSRTRWRTRLIWLAAGAVLGTALAALAAIPFGVFDRPAPPAALVFTVPVPNGPPQMPLAVSPDGRYLAFTAQQTPTARPTISIRALDSTDVVVLEGSDGPGSIIWSSDSRSVAYRSADRLKRHEIDRATSVSVCDLPAAGFNGGFWTQDGVIVFSSGRSLYRVAATGGPVAEVLSSEKFGHLGYFFPTLLPDGRHFVFFGASTDREATGVYAAALDGGAPTFIVRTDSQPQYANGFLLYVREGTLFAQQFDADRRSVSGIPIQIAEGLPTALATGRSPISAAGHVLAHRTGAPVNAELAWYDRGGKSAETVGDPGAIGGVRISPDGRLLAVSRRDSAGGQTQIWTTDLSTGITSRLTFEAAMMGDRMWAPDGRSVAYWTRRKGKTDLYHHALGARDAVPLYESPEDAKWLDDWSGDDLVFHRAADLFALPLSGDRKPRLVLSSPPLVDQAQVSPDRRFVAYGSNASGRWEIYVAPYPGGGAARQVSSQGGGQPHWRGDGKELIYLTLDGAVMSVSVTADSTGPLPVFGSPTRLFQSPLLRPVTTTDEYDVTRDGQRFLFVRRKEEPRDEVPITVSVNWTAALR